MNKNMSDNIDLIIKNGSCYIEGKLKKTDIGISGSKIKKIGKIELNSSRVYDATDKLILPGIIDTKYTLGNQVLLMQKT